MKTLFTKVLLIGIAGIGASIIMTWFVVLLVGLAGLRGGMPTDPGQMLTGLLGLIQLGLVGMLFGVAGGMVVTALCLVPALLLLHFAEKWRCARPVLLISAALMGMAAGAAFFARNRGVNSISNDLGLPVLCGMGGVIAAEIYIRVNRMWLRRRSPQS